MSQQLHDRLLADILTLNEMIWERRLDGQGVDGWLANFTGAHVPQQVEQIHALYLLSRFVYLGDREIRSLLRAAFRDLYRYPVIKQIRQANGNTVDPDFIKTSFTTELSRTRFIGVGNPSESGSHLLYYFRQENRLSKRLFLSPHQLFMRGRATAPQLRYPDVRHYVFIDDFAGSGSQAEEYSQDVLDDLFSAASSMRIECSYFPLVACTNALQSIRANTRFTRVESVLELDNTYAAFEPQSRYFRAAPDGLSRETARAVFEHYGNLLWSDHPLGWRNGQLLLGFHHNTPDNTVTAFWHDESQWQPAFRRYPKR